LKDAAHRLWPGISIVVVISAFAFLLARVPALAALGLSALTIAIVVGALLGNIARCKQAPRLDADRRRNSLIE
jgi:uncharacterized membrane protein YadS